MKKIILASNNKKKLAELKAILSDMDVELLSQSEAGCRFEVDENGTTLRPKPSPTQRVRSPSRTTRD